MTPMIKALGVGKLFAPCFLSLHFAGASCFHNYWRSLLISCGALTSAPRSSLCSSCSKWSETSLANLIASANGVLLKSEGYFLMQMVRGRASLNLYLRYCGRHIEQAAQIL